MHTLRKKGRTEPWNPCMRISAFPDFSFGMRTKIPCAFEWMRDEITNIRESGSTFIPLEERKAPGSSICGCAAWKWAGSSFATGVPRNLPGRRSCASFRWQFLWLAEEAGFPNICIKSFMKTRRNVREKTM